MSGVPRDPWLGLGAATPARIALGRAGASLPTREVLSFALSHARARDAVHADFDDAAVADELTRLGLAAVRVTSKAGDRATYLRRPDLGRVLDGPSRQRLQSAAGQGDPDIALVIGDGLSAAAVEANAGSLVAAFQTLCASNAWSLAPVVIAKGARVALGDEIGAVLRAKLVAVVIGERPGLSAADSLGIYLTFEPRPGRTDAERNCISNIRQNGLEPSAAAANLAWLVNAALALRETGVRLKDESEAGVATGSMPAPPGLPVAGT
ncbi:MAG: ethanolamine ammonia-lyase subunit EutC [Hyphomicrobiaceae bacterium]